MQNATSTSTGPAPLPPQALAVQAERADALNWLDQYAAAPPAVCSALRLATYDRDGLALLRSHIPFSHFNRVLTLGCPARVDEAAWAAVQAIHAGHQGSHWVLVNEHRQPADLDQQLQRRGHQPDGAWDRVLLRGGRPDLGAPQATGCEMVTSANAQDWSSFSLRCYGLPPSIGEWRHALVGRRGWLHALRREAGRSGAPVVMLRSAFVTDDRWCWLGIDAPVPGVMAACFDDDQKVAATLLQAAALAAAHSFVTDIEAASAQRIGPACRGWAELGLPPACLRRLFRSSP